MTWSKPIISLPSNSESLEQPIKGGQADPGGRKKERRKKKRGVGFLIPSLKPFHARHLHVSEFKSVMEE